MPASILVHAKVFGCEFIRELFHLLKNPILLTTMLSRIACFPNVGIRCVTPFRVYYLIAISYVQIEIRAPYVHFIELICFISIVTTVNTIISDLSRRESLGHGGTDSLFCEPYCDRFFVRWRYLQK